MVKEDVKNLPKRQVKNLPKKQARNLLRKNLREQAKNHPGFISSSSYWKNTINFPNDEETCKLEIVSISNWKSIDDWNNWFNSQKRQKIRNSYDDIIENETFNLLNKRTVKDDTFLL